MSTFGRAEDREGVVVLEQAFGIGSHDRPPDLEGLVLKFAPPHDRAVFSPIGNHACHWHVLPDLLGIHERIPNMCLDMLIVTDAWPTNVSAIRTEATVSSSWSPMARCPYRQD